MKQFCEYPVPDVQSIWFNCFKFCPATKSHSKVNFVRDIISWFRNLRIREYFSNKTQIRTEQNSVKKDTECSSLNWYIKKDGYPSNDNKTLKDYITKVTNDIETIVSDYPIQAGGRGTLCPPTGFSLLF